MATGAGAGAFAVPALRPGQTPYTHLELGALPTAVPCARLHARYVLQEWNLAELADTVELIVSELVTNAVWASADLTSSTYAGQWIPGVPPVRFWLASDGEHVVVQVWDANDQVPALQHPGPDAERARPGTRRVPGQRVGLVPTGAVQRQDRLGGCQPPGHLTNVARHYARGRGDFVT